MTDSTRPDASDPASARSVDTPRLVVFVAPFAADTTVRFVTAAAEHPGAHVVLLSQDPLDRFPERLRRALGGHWRVDNALDPDAVAEATQQIAARSGKPVHRLLGTLEQMQEVLAQVRDRLGIEGMGAETADLFRDKAAMKERLREAGVPCARHRLIRTETDALDFATEVGYPLVLKPPAGAGAKATHRVESADDLRARLAGMPYGPAMPLLAEEFMRGEEHSLDGVSIDGELVWSSLTHYLPPPLEVVENRWIQWCVLLPREIDHPRYDPAREAAAAALEALGMDTGVCHLEWFRRGDGSVAVSEVGARPGGAQISKLISYAHDVSFYRLWARVVIDGRFDPPTRRYAAGAVFLRGQGEGRRVKAIRGLEAAQKEIGHLVVEAHLPKPGQPTSSSYEGDGYVIVRHSETAVVEHALSRILRAVRVELG